MAQIQKFTKNSIVNQLRHVNREIQYPSNTDIDFSRTQNNYVLSPDRQMTSYEYFKERLSQLHRIAREDMVLLAGWVITAPKELELDEEIDKFFASCYEFLVARYGEENCVRAVVHKDEAGRPHLHFCFIPVVKNKSKINENIEATRNLKNKNPNLTYREMAEILGCSKAAVHKWLHTELQAEEKVSANDRININELKSFHSDLQKHLDQNGVKGKVLTGITKAQGGNMTVAQLKAQRAYLLEHGTDVNAVLKSIDTVLDLVEQETSINHGVEIKSRTDNFGVETIDFDI